MPRSQLRNPLDGTAGRDDATGLLYDESATNSRCCCAGSCRCGADGLGGLGDTLLASFADVVIPPQCFVDGILFLTPFAVGLSYFQIAAMPINGDYCLTRDPGSCQYRGTIPVTVNFNFGPGACVGCAPYAAPGCLACATTTAEIVVSMTWKDGVGAVPLIYVAVENPFTVETGPCRLAGTYANSFYPFFNDPLTTPQVLDCGGTVVIDNTAFYCTASDGFLVPMYNVAYAVIPAYTCLSPGTQFSGTVTLSDVAC